jgi:hypothetical protein
MTQPLASTGGHWRAACTQAASDSVESHRQFLSSAPLLSRRDVLVASAAWLATGVSACFLFAAQTAAKVKLRSQVEWFAAARADSETVSVRDSAADIWRKSQSLRPQPSMDTTPVSVKVGDISYKIPRNYIWNLHFDFPVLKVTYPGFRPLTAETRECFDSKPRAAPGCTALELNLRLWLPNKPRFENLMKLVPSEQKASARRNVDGYAIYDLGPKNARQEIYRGEDDDVAFTCKIFDNNGNRDGVCDDTVSLADGNAVWFFFRPSQTGDVRKIESGVRQLMSQFQAGADE